MLRRMLQSMVLVTFAGCASSYAGPLLTFSISSGSLTGNPADVVSWDFSIDNTDSPYYLFATESDVCVSGIPFPCTESTLGYYSDDLLFSPVVVAPGTNSGPLGELGNFTFTSPGTLTGSLFVGFSEYTTDPNDFNFDPFTDTVASNLLFQGGLNGGTVEPLPEPASLILLCTGLLGLAKIGANKSRGYRKQASR